MNVILIKDVKKLGKPGDVVKVSDGYARNMLLPRGMAIEATAENMKNLENQKALQAEKEAEELAAAKELAGKMEKITVKVLTKSGEGGKLFGSITAKDIADALKDQHDISLDRRKILLESPIKQVGEFELDVKLYKDVIGKLKVSVEV
ncbi:MAG: 50S ribosomal protein L9 [Anaerovoracaceae bacterium]|jgi:large subunit ribosomal protein L9